MNTYNTGKVKIGLLYTPPQVPHHDADALRLQRALLGERTRTDWGGIAIVAIVAASVALAAWLF